MPDIGLSGRAAVFETEFQINMFILVVGLSIILAMLIKAVFRRLRLPALVGYLFLGFTFRLFDTEQDVFLSESALWGFQFLGEIGIIVLLFRVGLESNVKGLLGQLSRASRIWIGDILLSGVFGFLVSFYLLHFALLPSLFVMVAFTATSVGVSVGVWQDANAMTSGNGELLLDVAELDDISGILLMSLLLVLAPILKVAWSAAVFSLVLKTTGALLLRLTVFVVCCVIFATFAERRLTRFISTREIQPDPMLTVSGIGFIIAALAGLLGFSGAIGAFFAGLVFSRDPEAVKIDASFAAVYDLFSPFFFIGLGLNIDPAVLAPALVPGLLLLLAAVFGKLIGAGGPALLFTNRKSALLLGLSMIPRAEIAMVIMYHGLRMGAWAVPAELYAAVTLVSAATCVLVPLVLYPLLQRWPQREREIGDK